MTYQDLGSRQGIGTINSAVNSGNWTVEFDPKDVASQQLAEVYHMTISGPSGSTFTIYRGTQFWDNVARGDINSWDPTQPLPMRPGDSLFFYWSTNVPPAPVVTIWLRQPE